MKLDPHKHQHFYDNWKKKGMQLKGLSAANAKLLRDYLEDMELGHNINPASKKGSRSPGRLRNQKGKLHAILLTLQQRTTKKSVTKITELEILSYFGDMRKGKVNSPRTGKPYNATGSYVKSFKAFYHWYMRSSKKKGKIIADITEELDSKDEKPKFNYFTADQLRAMCDNATFDYKVLMMFLFDSGIRAPTELMNVRASDLQWIKKDNCYRLHIREETSKTFGRKIKLMLSSDILKSYVDKHKLNGDAYLFTKQPKVMNKYLSRLGHKTLGFGDLQEKKNPKDPTYVRYGITLYDFRHCATCYWLVRYKSESALKYRFGWKKSEMIHYYSEFLGMKDTIQEEDLYVDITKTELQRELDKVRTEMSIREERFVAQQQQMDRMNKILEAIANEQKIKKAKS
ncbi:hypothetical protein HOC01_01410 [archaeon]|jgi:integrase|nr:hypothetical protein [archaeon]MBT6698022.1 hypothetical protein [archaeon]